MFTSPQFVCKGLVLGETPWNRRVLMKQWNLFSRFQKLWHLRKEMEPSIPISEAMASEAEALIKQDNIIRSWNLIFSFQRAS